MKTSVTTLVAVVVSFALGFYARGLINTHDDAIVVETIPTPAVTNNSAQVPYSAADAATDSPPSNISKNGASDPAANIGETDSEQGRPASRYPLLDNPRMRAQQLESMREMLAEFFEINGIDAIRAEQIIQDLIEMQIEMSIQSLDMQAAMDTGASSDDDEIVMFDRELMRQLRDETQARQRDILGIYYDAYSEYMATYQYRSLLNSFSSSLEAPLNASTREELLRIMVEESPPALEPENIPTTPEEMTETMRSRLEAIRARNEAVERRARSYLTPSEFELLTENLDIEAEQLEMSIKMMELSRR